MSVLTAISEMSAQNISLKRRADSRRSELKSDTVDHSRVSSGAARA